MKNLIFILSLSLSFVGCPGEKRPDNYLTIFNNTEEEIHVFFNIKSIFDKRGIEGLPYDKIEPSRSYREGFLNEIYDNNEVMVFIFVKDTTFKKYTLQEIDEQMLYDKRYDLTLEDLKEMDFKIVYTGEEDESLDEQNGSKSF